MNRIFGFSRNAVALAGIVVAIILVVLVGMIIVGSAAIRALMAPGLKVDGVSLLALLVTIIVLLVAIFIVLLILLRCCCRDQGKRDDMPPDLAALLPMLPVLKQVPNLLSDLGVAIYAAGMTLAWIQTNIGTAAAHLKNAADNSLSNVSIPVFKTHDDGNGGRAINLTPPDGEWVNPLDGLLGPLRDLSANIAPNLLPNPTFPLRLNNANKDVAAVAATLVAAGRLLAKAGKDLNADRVPPSEVVP